MLTIADIDEATILAEQSLQEWEQTWQEMFRQPLIMAQRVMEYLNLPKDERRQLALDNPEMYARIEAQVKRIRRQYGNTNRQAIQ